MSAIYVNDVTAGELGEHVSKDLLVDVMPAVFNTVMVRHPKIKEIVCTSSIFAGKKIHAYKDDDHAKRLRSATFSRSFERTIKVSIQLNSNETRLIININTELPILLKTNAITTDRILMLPRKMVV